MRKKKTYSYDVNDPFDKEMILDLPFNELNKKGRKEKRKQLIRGL